MNQSSSKGKSSSALLSATGGDYAEWFQLLDAWDAPGRGHREIADWLVGQGCSDWWAQKLIVEYQQDRGLRQPVARTGGSFAGGASKTVPVLIDRLYAAFADSELRRSWLSDPRAHRAYETGFQTCVVHLIRAAQTRNTLGEHGLADTRRAVEKHVMPTGSSYLTSPLSLRLTDHIC